MGLISSFIWSTVRAKDVQAAMGGGLDFCVVRKSNMERPGTGGRKHVLKGRQLLIIIIIEVYLFKNNA